MKKKKKSSLQYRNNIGKAEYLQVKTQVKNVGFCFQFYKVIFWREIYYQVKMAWIFYRCLVNWQAPNRYTFLVGLLCNSSVKRGRGWPVFKFSNNQERVFIGLLTLRTSCCQLKNGLTTFIFTWFISYYCQTRIYHEFV